MTQNLEYNLKDSIITDILHTIIKEWMEHFLILQL